MFFSVLAKVQNLLVIFVYHLIRVKIPVDELISSVVGFLISIAEGIFDARFHRKYCRS